MHINHQPPPPIPPPTPIVIPEENPWRGTCFGDQTVQFGVDNIRYTINPSEIPILPDELLAKICQTVVILTASPTGQPGEPTTPNLGSGVWLTNDDGSIRIFTADHVIPNEAISVQIHYPISTVFVGPIAYQPPNPETYIDLACAGKCQGAFPTPLAIDDLLTNPQLFRLVFAGAPLRIEEEARQIHIFDLGSIGDGVITDVRGRPLDQSVMDSPYFLQIEIAEQARLNFGSLPGASGGPLFAINNETGEIFTIGVLKGFGYLGGDQTNISDLQFVTIPSMFQGAQNDVPPRFLDTSSILQLLQADPSQDLASQQSETLNAHPESNLFDPQFKYIFEQIRTNLINQYPQIDPNQINILAHALTSNILEYDPLAVDKSDEYLASLLGYPITADQKAQIGYAQWIIDALLEQGYAYWQIADPTQLIPDRPITENMNLINQYAKRMRDWMGPTYDPKMAFVNEALLWGAQQHPNQDELTILQQNALKMCLDALFQNAQFIEMTNPGTQVIKLDGSGFIHFVELDYNSADPNTLFKLESNGVIQAYIYSQSTGQFRQISARSAHRYNSDPNSPVQKIYIFTDADGAHVAISIL